VHPSTRIRAEDERVAAAWGCQAPCGVPILSHRHPQEYFIPSLDGSLQAYRDYILVGRPPPPEAPPHLPSPIRQSVE